MKERKTKKKTERKVSRKKEHERKEGLSDSKEGKMKKIKGKIEFRNKDIKVIERGKETRYERSK